MIVTNRQLVESQNALASLVAVPLPSKTSYWIGKIADKAIRELKRYDAERAKLVERFGKKGEDGKLAVVSEGEGKGTVECMDPEAFTREHDELLAIEVELTGVRLIRLDELAEAKLPGSTFRPLGWMIDDAPEA